MSDDSWPARQCAKRSPLVARKGSRRIAPCRSTMPSTHSASNCASSTWRAWKVVIKRRDRPSSSFSHGATGDAVVVDARWQDRAIDLEVGDLAAVPADVVREGECVDIVRAQGDMTRLRGAAAGRGRVVTRDGSWSAYVRVARRGYIGRSIFRHLEDP